MNKNMIKLMWKVGQGLTMLLLEVKFQGSDDVVDGRNPAAPGMKRTLYIMGQ